MPYHHQFADSSTSTTSPATPSSSTTTDPSTDGSTPSEVTTAGTTVTVNGMAATETFSSDFNNFDGTPTGYDVAGNPTWDTLFFGSRNPGQYTTDSLGDSTQTNPFTVANGALNITASPGSNQPGDSYTSGLISSQTLFAQEYGYFDMKATVPTSSAGMWPAFFLLPSSQVGPAEIDVLEGAAATQNVVYNTLHSNALPAGTPSYGEQGVTSIPNLASGEHDFGLSWTANTIDWFIDGQKTFSAPTPADMHQPMYMLATLAVGSPGSWVGTATGESATMSIDSITAYQYTNSQT